MRNDNYFNYIPIFFFFKDVPGEIFIKSEKDVINSNEGTNITITCECDANPPAFFQWIKYQKNQYGIIQELLLQKSYSGNLNMYLLTTNDTADYKCIATNYPDNFDRSKEFSTSKKITVNVRCKA